MKLLRANDLEFHKLIDCASYVYLWKGHPLADRKEIRQEELSEYPCLSFEPGEEVFNGAEAVLKTGVLNEVSEFYGLHSDPSMEIGEVGIKEGGVMAAVDRFKVNVNGKGTHAASPQLGNNPVTVAISMISALQNFASRKVSPVSPSVVTFTHIEGGTAWNIIPETAFFEGTVRTLDNGDRASIKAAFYRIAREFGVLYQQFIVR